MTSGNELLARNPTASTARLGAALLRSAIRNGKNATGSTTCACDAEVSSWDWTVGSIGLLFIFSSLSEACVMRTSIVLSEAHLQMRSSEGLLRDAPILPGES